MYSVASGNKQLRNLTPQMPRAPGLDADRSRSKLWQMLQRSMQPRRCCAVFLGASSHYFTPKSQHLLFVFLPKDCPAMYQFFSKCGALGGAASLENILKLIKSLKPHSRPTEWTPLCVNEPSRCVLCCWRWRAEPQTPTLWTENRLA